MITRIFETHRNADLLSDAASLAEQTGATVYHGPNPAGEVVYAQTVREGEQFRIGSILIKVLETPGHTDDSVSYVLHDTESGDNPLAVFTGDALYVGDVGRTDFYPDRARDVAGLLFDSLRKLESLGDPVEGFLRSSLVEWAAAGEAFASLPPVDAVTVKERLHNADGWTLLDVRSKEAFDGVRIAGAEHVYLGELPGKLAALDATQHHTVMCGSGARATVAASLLSQAGFRQVDVFLGSLAAWRQCGYGTDGKAA